MALNYLSTQLVDGLKVAREYFGPEVEHWPDDEVVHRLMIRALDLQRQLNEARHDRPPTGDQPGVLLCGSVRCKL